MVKNKPYGFHKKSPLFTGCIFLKNLASPSLENKGLFIGFICSPISSLKNNSNIFQQCSKTLLESKTNKVKVDE